MIPELLIFITMWIAFCGLWHEYMHALAGHLTKTVVSYIKPVFKPFPSFRYHHVGGNQELIGYSGGVFTSIILFALVFITDNYWQQIFFTLAWVQLCYGIYEGLGYNYKFEYGRYVLYLIVVVITWKTIGV